MKPVREPAVAGRFYPRGARELSATVRDLLRDARCDAPLSGRLVALAAPHAGYVYSGSVAAAAYARVTRGAFPRVVVIAPSHRIPHHGSSIYERGGYRTPLGLIAVDEEFASMLLSKGGGAIVADPELHRNEHSLEVQLPFLQEALGEFRLTPIIVGNQGIAHVRRLSNAIAETVTALGAMRETLIVASTDLSHYYSDERAREMDGVVMADVEAFDVEALRRHIDAGECEACGAGPLLATLQTAASLGARTASCLAYATSADASGDRAEVVGYMAAAMMAPHDA
ncbi:MAG: AmmeMemoRadiSam system protein B [bacterium]